MAELKINPYGPPPWFRSFMSRHLDCLYEESSGINEDLLDKLAEKYQVNISRIAHGVPVGGELEYVDGNTLAHALSGRKSYQI